MIKIVVIILYPVIKCLRLADTNKPGMDKIWYYARQTSKRIDKTAKEFSRLFSEENFLPGYTPEIDDDDDEYNDISDDESAVSYDDDRDEYNDVKQEKDSDSDEEELGDETFGVQVKRLWKLRYMQLKSDYAICGWLLSVKQNVFEDAKLYTVSDENALRRVATKLYSHCWSTVDIVNKVMDQFLLFRNREGCFSNPAWWSSLVALKGESHLFHGQLTIEKAPELAYVACKVTSKLLGIGNCERQWDQTKFCCNGKRALISSDRLKKQATMYGSHCLSNGKLTDEYIINNWTDDDLKDKSLRAELEEFMNEIDSGSTCTNATKKTSNVYYNKWFDVFDDSIPIIKYFKAYMEEWEKELYDSNTNIAKYKFLHKYKGLKYVWPEDNAYAATICDETLVYVTKKTAKQNCEKGGWCVVLIPKGLTYEKEKIDEYEHEPINSVNHLHLLISSTEQDSHVVCLDECNNFFNAQSVFEENFSPIQYNKWDDFPNNTKLKIEQDKRIKGKKW